MLMNPAFIYTVMSVFSVDLHWHSLQAVSSTSAVLNCATGSSPSSLDSHSVLSSTSPPVLHSSRPLVFRYSSAVSFST